MTSSRPSVFAMEHIRVIIAINAEMEAWQRLTASAMFQGCVLVLTIRCALATENARIRKTIAIVLVILDISHLCAIPVQINLS